ncbi:MAG: alpha/beta hydrolase [Candidatus Woesearchaeota archaeon]|jgi:predicted alpha/beta hydrolase family esterase|nr:alpha/beta hydrolase [Candidatus Woesearchaeota archaeon]
MNIILIQGKDANPTQKWYPWLETQIKQKSLEYKAPALPNANDPDINEWMDELTKINPNSNSILIGHSRGGVATLRWLEKQTT